MNENKDNLNSTLDGANATRDENISLDSFLKENLVETAKEPENNGDVETPKVETETVRPKGMIIRSDELKEAGPKKNLLESEIDDYAKETLSDMDMTMKKREAVVLIKDPTDQQDYINMMLEIEAVTFDATGAAHLDLVDKDGNHLTPKFIRLREEGDESGFDLNDIDENIKPKNPSNSNDETSEADAERQQIIELIIDKTGQGSNIDFTPEEREKLTQADTIKLNEVKIVDINAFNSKRKIGTFEDAIKPYASNGIRTTVCFPASGFKAQMKGMTYGEYADIAASPELVTFDKYNRELTVIYNNMTNISTGPFDSYEDFLKNFAYTDIPIALYGLFVSTENENQDIELKCGNEDCEKTFGWKFKSREIYKVDKLSNIALNKIKQLVSAPAIEFDNIKNESAVQNSKFIELPESGYIVEVGVVSAYDMLHNFVPLLDEETFKREFGEENSEVYYTNLMLLTGIRSVSIPQEDGSYIECIGYKDLLNALYTIKPSEIRILAAYVGKVQEPYSTEFSLGEVVCPHCGHVTPNMTIEVNDLLFQTYQKLMSTEIDLSMIPNL